ncbi:MULTISPECIES: S8 family serine peptidase [Paenibacillus]|uniref:Peptidase inhibitor I9 n=1 Tax=Paenibacillus pabuli TaxID=1472 RepID=A0A855XXY6_9BACL|nr:MULTISPECIES: S8 family serine peptidase [Paenibacillus]PWW43202.1 peptidase inhibitor I9 [Paenibacillus pabuli]PXW09108.1 peptidase inhibitor I9 [Paenibacillus taichungensis]
MKRKSARLLSGFIATGVLLSSMFSMPAYAAPAYGALQPSESAKSILQFLTKEERQALNQLQVMDGEVIDAKVNTKSSDLVNVIVQFKSEPAAVALKRAALNNEKMSELTATSKVKQNHQQFKQYMKSLQQKRDLSYDAASIQITQEYETALNGVALTIPGIAVEDLMKSGVVKKVWADQEVALDLPETDTPSEFATGGGMQPRMADSVPYLGIDKLHEEGITGKGIKVGVLDTGIDYNHPDLTGAYKGYRAHAGEDPKQVDPTTVKGWDFVDNDADPMETTYKDWENSGYNEQGVLAEAYYTSHGTHVSGTIAGQAKNDVGYAVKGVAPDVDLYVYRVLGPGGSGDMSGIIAGIDKAIEDELDVINLSLGAATNDPLDPSSIALNNAMLQGVVSMVAAGNDGPNEGTLGTPGASALAITIGASDVPLTIPTATVTLDVYSNPGAGETEETPVMEEEASSEGEETSVEEQEETPVVEDEASAEEEETPVVDEEAPPTEEEIPATDEEAPPAEDTPALEEEVPAVGEEAPTKEAPAATYTEELPLFGKDFTDNLTTLEGKTYELVYAGLGNAFDFEGIDVQGKVALISRGEIALDAKIVNARKAGAAAAIIYNNVEGTIPNYLGEMNGYIPTFQMMRELGEKLKELNGVTVTFGAAGQTVTEGNKLADFSSRGPANVNDDIKPDIVAPGVAVFSTYPVFVNDHTGENYNIAYARISGTSMATPHMAGIAALMLQAHGDYTPFDVKTALMNTAVDLNGNYSVYEVGAGRVDPYRAVHTSVLAKVQDKTIHISNDESILIDEITGSIVFDSAYLEENGQENVSDSRTVKIENKGDRARTYTTSMKLLNDMDLNVHLPESITVSSGSTEEMTVSVEIPQDTPSGRYEGYVYLDTENAADHIQIPFSIRISEKGITSVEMIPPSITNDTPFHQFLNRITLSTILLGSPMDSVDVLLKDRETGEEIGFVGTMNTQSMLPGIEYMILNLFKGYAFPIENGQISNVARFVPEGNYTLEIIGADSESRQYSYETLVVVDNTAPEIDLGIEPGVYELNDSMLTEREGGQGVWYDGTAIDSTIQTFVDNGITDYDQSSNRIIFYENGSPFYSGELPVSAEGSISFGITKEEYDNGYELRLFGMDVGTAANPVKDHRYGFISEGKPYVTSKYDKDQVRKGDTITQTIQLNNVEKLNGISFILESMYDYKRFNRIEPTPELQALLDETGAEVKFSDPVVDQRELSFEASISGGSFEGITGDLDLFHVVFDVPKDEFYMKKNDVPLLEVKYTTVGMKENEEKLTLTAFNTASYEVISKSSRTYGYVRPEAFMVNGEYLDFANDYSKMGIEVYAETASGERYEGTIQRHGEFLIDDIPATGETMTIYTRVPGHLPSRLAVVLSKSIKGEYYGINQLNSSDFTYAGDINGDGAIDIYDMELVTKHYHTSDEIADIDQDGYVGDTEVNYITNNFGMTANYSTKEPVLQIGDKDLGYFLNKIQEMNSGGSGNNGGGSGNNGGGGASTTPAPVPAPAPTTEPDPSPNQVITEKELKAVTNGIANVNITVGQTIELPVNAGDLLGKNSLTLSEQGLLSLTIPSSVLKELQTKGGPGAADGKIILDINKKDVKLPAAKQGLTWTTAGAAYEVELYLQVSSEKLSLSSLPEDVTLTLHYDRKLNSDLIGMYTEHSTANQWDYAGGIVDEEKGSVTSQLSDMGTYAPFVYDKSFEDVAPTHWASEAIKSLSAKHVLTGRTETVFDPQGQTTRAEFAALIVRTLGLEVKGNDTPFGDVSKDTWYADSVAAAYQAGLVQGVANDTFAPTQIISREEMAVLMMRAYEYQSRSQSNHTKSAKAGYTDEANIASWAKEAVAKASELGVMKGSTGGEFKPKNNATRAETAQTVHNLLSLLK